MEARSRWQPCGAGKVLGRRPQIAAQTTWRVLPPEPKNVQPKNWAEIRAINYSPELQVPQLTIDCSHSRSLHLPVHGCGRMEGQKAPQRGRPEHTGAWVPRGHWRVRADDKGWINVRAGPVHVHWVRPPPPSRTRLQDRVSTQPGCELEGGKYSDSEHHQPTTEKDTGPLFFLRWANAGTAPQKK
jgi:hypothetical protein